MKPEDLDVLKSPGPPSNYKTATRSAPAGWEPGIKYDASGAMTVITPPTPPLESESEWRRLLEDLGARVPAGHVVRLLEAKYDPYAWTRERDGEDATTKPAWRYKFAIEPARASALELDELLEDVRRWRPPRRRPAPAVGGSSYLVAYSDTQIGKPDGDGTAGTVDRVLSSTAAAVHRLRELRRLGRPVDSITIALLGDHVEGYNSQGGRLAWRNELTLTEMIRVWRKLLLQIVKTFGPLADRVVVVVVPGNHDEAVRTGDVMSTRYDDSWAVDAASAVADALEEASGYDHVSFVFPGQDELTVTLDVAGTIVGFAHGHQTRGKTHEWWGRQAHGLQPIGDATLLLTGHYHHLKIEQAGAKTWIQSPALDGGSTWWRHRTGQEAPAGLVTMLVGGGSWSDLAVL